MKTRILFVDDQPEILAGLRRMLRGFRDEWQMEFVDGPELALAMMEQCRYEVVVSDMFMPGMNGTEFLSAVMRRYPETVRIILSGQADQQSIFRAVTPAHQFLSKPCDPEILKATVARACSLRSKLSQESLIRVVSQVTSLPSLPHVYNELLQELQSEDASVKRVADLISRDVGMSAKLMQLVNSSFFGTPRRVESPSHATAMLGLKVLKPLILSAGIFSQFDACGLHGYSLDTLMDHSLMVSHLAHQFAWRHGDDKVLAEDSLVAGLLHDVGQLILAANLKTQYRDTLALARDQQLALYEAEVERLGASHADVGAYLLGLWGLPDPIVEAVAYHHCPLRCPAGSVSPLTFVHVANVLANESLPSAGITLSLTIDEEYLDRLGVADQLSKWRSLSHEYYSARCQLT